MLTPKPLSVDVTIVNDTISAEVKEGSIESKHLAPELKEEIEASGVEYAGKTTNTIETTVGNERTEAYDAFSLTTAIPINSDDVKCKIVNKTTRGISVILVCYDEEENGFDEISGDLTDDIDLTQYIINVHHLTVCLNGLGGPGETIEAIITSANPTISAEVIDGSIGMGKLADDVKQKLDNAGGGSAGLETLVPTNTIDITTGEIRTYTFDLANIMTVTIPISSVDTHIELNSSVGLMTLFVPMHTQGVQRGD